MLKGWNRKVRMTSAMISACTITRRVSANRPCWRFSSVDTLIGFLVHRLIRTVPHLSREQRAALAEQGSRYLRFLDETDRWISIGTRCVRHLPRIVDELRGDPGSARAEMPDVVTGKGKFDPV